MSTDGRGAVWLRLARIVWLVLAVGGTALFVAAPISAWSQLQTVCSPALCTTFQLDADSARTLTGHGIPVTAFAIYTAGVFGAVWLLWFGLSGLIVWRKPEDRGALAAAFFLVLFPQLIIGQLAKWWTGGGIVAFVALILFGLLFPAGRLEPRWTRWLVVLYLLLVAADTIPSLGNGGYWIVPVLILPFTLVGIQIYRFRRISTPAQRQQTKWAMLGLIIGILGLIIFILPGVFAVNDVQNGGYYSALNITGFALVPSVIPVAIAIGVLRSGLWDIDRVISRALAWSALTVMLVGLYVGGVIGLQALFGLVVGSSSAPAIAISTLAIVALFGPMRRRIQVLIDRRFYRSRYDAATTVAFFTERLRDQIDLGNLAQELTVVVQDTLQPEHVSLWLRGGDLRPVMDAGPVRQ